MYMLGSTGYEPRPRRGGRHRNRGSMVYALGNAQLYPSPDYTGEPVNTTTPMMPPPPTTNNVGFAIWFVSCVAMLAVVGYFISKE